MQNKMLYIDVLANGEKATVCMAVFDKIVSRYKSKITRVFVFLL